MANIIRHHIKKRKQIYYNRFKNKDNKIWWKIVNDANGKNNKHQDTQFSAEQLNDGYHQVWNGLKQPDITKFIEPPNANDYPIITEGMVTKELARLDTTKAAGPDNINNKILKEARHHLSAVITHLFNLSIKHSFSPSQWKTASIVPLPKTTNPTTTGDYRPIALTSALCKVLERIISKEILNHTKKIWETNKQYGFLPGRNTMDALLQVIEDWEKAIDEKKTVHAVFFDFAKAFDLVDHNILITKIDKMLPKWINSWVAQYLTGRKQRVKSNNKLSEWLEVIAGVIQGSVLGPTLFILFISDLNEYLPDTTDLTKFADDLLTYCIFNNINDDTTQEAVNRIQKWTDDNKMKLNTNKTKHMIINQGNLTPTIIKLNGQTLEQVKNYKYLGVLINDELDYNVQWEQTAKTTNCHIYLIKQLKRMGFKEEILVNVYQSITLSQYLYNAPLLCSTNEMSKAEMVKQQNRFFDIIGITPEKALFEYNIIPIEAYIDQQCLNIVERILKDPYHPITQKQNQTHQYNTRNKTIVNITQARTSKYQKSCVQQSLRIMRDGYKNKYTDPRKQETTTNNYLMELQHLKQQNKRLKRAKAKGKHLQAKHTQLVSNNTTTNKCQICNKILISAQGLKIHTAKMHK